MASSLFILKRREDYNQDPSYGNSHQIATGMWNSASFVKDMLAANSRPSDVEMVIDANGIDSVVTALDPDFVFIEGLWVTPAKFAELLAIPRHQTRTWVVRIHSEIPFLATEGVAMDWIEQYLQMGIKVAPNAARAHQQISWYARKAGLSDAQVAALVPYLPNSYPTDFQPLQGLDTSDKVVLDVGCFGAFRPLKNHLQQAMLASHFAQELGLPLRFHVNSRTDQGGAPAAKNTAEFILETGAELVDHGWEDRSTFLQSLSACDLLLQVSMSETFNIVAADATYVGRPILVSNEISWAHPLWADPQNVDASLKALRMIWANKPYFIGRNRLGLKRFVDSANQQWLRFIPLG